MAANREEVQATLDDLNPIIADKGWATLTPEQQKAWERADALMETFIFQAQEAELAANQPIVPVVTPPKTLTTASDGVPPIVATPAAENPREGKPPVESSIVPGVDRIRDGRSQQQKTLDSITGGG